MKKQYFQPMTLLEVEVDLRQRLQLQKLKDARLLSAYVSIPFSPEKLALSLFIAEFLNHALRSEQQNELLFVYLVDAMQWLDITEKGFANFHLTFLMRMSRFLGFYPNLDDYVEGSVFDLRAATFSTMHLYRFNRQDRNRIVDVLLQYYRLHIPQFPELKSLGVLQELWAD